MSEDFEYEEFHEEEEEHGAVVSSEKTIIEKSAGISSSTILHIILIALLAIFVKYVIEDEKEAEVEAKYLKPKKIEELEKIEEVQEEIQEQVEVTEMFNFSSPNPTPTPSPLNQETTTDQPDVTPDVPSIIDSAPSTVQLAGLFASRSAGGRLAAMTQFGGGGTDNMVLRALEWLKDNQNSDGSWDNTKPAQTGFGLLAFLAYGQTPSSELFGPTVARAIDWLSENFNEGTGTWGGLDGHHYAHAIATYAVAEAYAMTKNPNLKYIMEEAIGHIIDGTIVQRVGRVGSMRPVYGLDSGDSSVVHGGWWNYNYDNGAYPDGYKNEYMQDGAMMKPRLAPAKARKDNSFVGFQLQALKAAKAAGSSNPKLQEAIELGVNGVKHMQGSTGAYHYSSSSPEKKGGGGSKNQLGVGCYTLQLLEGGYEKSPEVQKSLEYMGKLGFEPDGSRAAYRIYYLANASYWGFGYANGNPTPKNPGWVNWNNAMKQWFRQTQNKDGSWTGDQSNAHGTAYTTSLGALSLMVYYRNLPGSVGEGGKANKGGPAQMATQRKPEFKAKLIDTKAGGDDDFEEF